MPARTVPPTAPPPPAEMLASLVPRTPARQSLSQLLGQPDLIARGGTYGHWSTRLARGRERDARDDWLAVRLARHLARTALPVALPAGTPISHTVPPPAVALLSRLDRAAESVPGPLSVSHPQRAESARRAAARAEAIASVSLAGGELIFDSTLEVLLEQRSPASEEESWAAGVHRCLAESDATTELTPASLLAMHERLCAGTPAADRGGRLRSAREAIEPNDELGDFSLRPPPARELEGRLEAVCRFLGSGENGAGKDANATPFVHPLVRAAVARMVMVCDRPFAGGNALMARIVWRLATTRAGWPVGEFLAPSRVLLSVRGRYPRALHYTLTDDGDATYFILLQLEVLGAALELAHEELAARATADERLASRVQRIAGFAPSHRQTGVLARALRRPDSRFMVAGHQRAHGTVYETARADLQELASHSLLEQRREGRAFVFVPARGLPRVLAKDD